MIILRRLLTIPLGFLLFVLLFVALVVLQVGGTFLDPGFYPKELAKADFYEFLLVEVTTSALDEARELDVEDLPGELSQNPLVALNLSTAEIVTSLNTAIPPEWVQSIVEQLLDELGSYVTGRSDEFEVTIQAGDQVLVMVGELSSLMRRADFYNFMFEDLVNPAIEDVLADELPLGLTVTTEQLESSVRSVVTREWIENQVDATLDEVTPYFIGRSDEFEIRLVLEDRIAIAIAEVKRLLLETDTYDLLYDEVVEPLIIEFVGESIDLPLGFEITSEEIISAMREVAPPSWVQAQATTIIDDASPYITGEVDTFAVTVSLATNKVAAVNVLEDLADKKVSDRLAGLRSGILRDGLERGAANIVRSVGPSIINRIPDSITFTESDLRDALSQQGTTENLDLLDDLREIIRDGWTYTDVDLREDIREAFIDSDGDEAIDRLDDIRAFLADGWTYTDVDFREDLEDDRDVLSWINFFRSLSSWARRLQFLIYLPTLAVLVGIGFLGGRNWSSRIAWGAGALVVVSAIIFMSFGATYGILTDSPYEELKQEVLAEIDPDDDFDTTLLLVIDKGFDMGKSVIDGFSSGVTTRAVILLLIGLITLGASLYWSTITGLVRSVRSR